jgi:hypothetical protein
VRGRLTSRGRTGAKPETTLALVRAAILAASPHNTQPWLFKITNSSIELHIDTQRNVGALDPYLREEHIGTGCALENLMLAASAHGYKATAALLPGKLGPIPAAPKTQLLARVNLTPGKREENELYNAPAAPHESWPLRSAQSDFARFRRRTQPSAERLRRCKAIPLHG